MSCGKVYLTSLRCSIDCLQPSEDFSQSKNPCGYKIVDDSAAEFGDDDRLLERVEVVSGRQNIHPFQSIFW